MDNFLFNVLASVTASYIVYLISKLIKKVKSHSTVNYTPLRRQLKYVKLSKTRRVLLCLKLKYHQSKKSKQLNHI
ncbi:type I toxin-antitoxin system toxin [Clostridioides difficile]|uniref:type I toxin-antitoxin system toxin n=1 Tax=Clostridioides difficile TaxID=1496 RepID=UPI003AB7195D